MWKNVQVFVCAVLTMSANIAWSSDACSSRAITASADVQVSDGSSFRIESYFHSKDAAAIRHIRDSQQIIVVEGPQSWTGAGDETSVGTDFHKLFALGHQFHAFLLHFEDLVSNVRQSNAVLFAGQKHRATSGDYPYGGVVHLIEGDDASRPAGLLFEFPENTLISVSFDDWQDSVNVRLPFRMQIDDGDRIFEYRYKEIDVTPRSPLWFFDAVGTPSSDLVQVYRLHRKLLAAHCLGDADMLADLSAPNVLSVNRGELRETSREETRQRFAALFQRVNYTGYHDLVMPVIKLAASSDIGWIGVNVRADGAEIQTGASFSDQWAWVMMVERIDNVWLHTGNASSKAE